ncbi:related to cleft lip and palate transmembrane protein 1 (CLPTM1) [Cephalotrichum gorgonifer]|uniref:Related to cleft lip and palate transmembrane protein 1 (CLPTM1) n=1 Tax=Cephalotrichum gorgonifer TaxID=2041049 RepID=A0AAE8STN4_9PEZI|nr:related to cleft lip and palate transmembrane protein 1 (CLPTM1) [Cephalotrichum gorgonifer]
MPQDAGTAATGVQPAAGQRERQAPEQSSALSSPIFRLVLGGGVYFLINILISWYFAKQQNGIQVTGPAGNLITVPANTEDVPAYLLRPSQLNEGATYRGIPKKIAPIWAMDSYVDIVVAVSPSFAPTPISDIPSEFLIMDEKSFHLGNYSDKRSVDGEFTVPPRVQNNGTLWGHFYVSLPGSEIDPTRPGYDIGSAYHFSYPLTGYFPKKKVVKTRNLLDDLPAPVEEEEEEDKGPVVIANYYHPNTSLSFIPDTGVMDYSMQHPATRQFLRLEASGARDGTGQNSWYYPVLFVNTFWQLRSQMVPLNETVKTLPIHVDLGNLRSWQFKILSAMEMSTKEAARQAAFGHAAPGGSDGSEIELIKEVLIDTNPILLAVTTLVTIAHLVLETLAFGSDIAHYRKKKDNVGISVRSILANVFMQSVILLYLVDNSQNTSWIIFGSQAVGIFIELWKITTVVDVTVGPLPPGSLLPYGIKFSDKQGLSETEEKTKEYDEIAFKYMYMAGVPLLIAYAVYSLIYDSHKSWYSYVITTLVGSVYAYGFLLMVPSLYINYRLKSVAHMPAKAMMYKFLNTFIDDLFAFTIKMPLLHRLATLRDDVIFFVYLYQKWAYKVDYTRVNEFGQDGEADAQAIEAAKEKKDGAEKEQDQAVGTKAEGGAVSTGTEKKRATKRK